MTAEPKRYRKKPVQIEAIRYDHTNAELLREWSDGAVGYEHRTTGGINVNTLEGPIWARVGDYIIKGVAGEFYPCKPDIFEKTYELVESWEPPYEVENG